MRKKINFLFKCGMLLWGLLLFFQSAEAQEQKTLTVTGVVTEGKTNTPLPGVNVIISGSKRGTITDVDGKYSISDVPVTGKLEFTFIGFDKAIRAVAGNSVINVAMSDKANSLDEVVVVGYGVVRKSELTSSISTVKETDISKTPVTTIDQALQGNAAGVVVINTSAEPGGNVDIHIRGNSSVLADYSPLIVIDGFPTDNNALTSLNPNDIASMEILKDASATAIYGSRGANGVIMITTKKGIEGKPKVDAMVRVSLAHPRYMLQLMDGPLYEQYSNSGRIAMGSKPASFIPDTCTTKNYQSRLILPRSIAQEYSVSVNGGTSAIGYLFSGAVLKQPGLLKNSGFDRMNLRGRIDMNMDTNLKGQFEVTYSATDKQQIGSGDSGAVYRTVILSPLGASTTYIDAETGEIVTTDGVLGAALNTSNNTKVGTTSFNGSVNWDIIPKHLFFITRGGYRLNQSQLYFYVPRSIYYKQSDIDKNNKSTRNVSNTNKWTNENTLTYMNTFGAVHNLTALVGQTWERTNNNGFATTVNGFATDDFMWNDLAGAKTYTSVSSSSYIYSLFSLLGRVMYSYDRKYLITGTLRSDASSRFGVNSKWGTFPSISGAWVASSENFLKNSNVISNLKFRLSYGLTGNDKIGNYSSLTTLSSTKILINGTSYNAYTTNNLGDQSLKWEQTAETNAAFDLGLFKNRFTLSFDAYDKTTKNLLYNKKTPAQSGYSSVTTNVGSVQNRGLELEMALHNTFKRFTWDCSFNGSYNQSKILDLGGDDMIPGYTVSGSGISDPITYLIVGQPLGTFFGYKRDGVYKDWNDVYSSKSVWLSDGIDSHPQPGYPKYVDTNGDGIINEYDKVPLGYANPDWMVGFTNTFSYSGFRLTVFFQGAFGNKIFNGNSQKLQTFRGGSNNQTRFVLDSWRPINSMNGDPGYTGTLPRSIYNTDYQFNLTDLYLEDGSYLRLKTLSLGYDIPQSFTRKVKIRSMSLLFQITNLLTFTRYTGMDPESSSSMASSTSNPMSMGVDLSSYPAAKTYVMTLQLGL